MPRIYASRALAVLAVGVVGLVAGAPSTVASTRSTTSGVLHMAFEGDMGAPDPDVFYATEGLEVTTSVYQGLLQYANNSTRIVGDLARSWTVSPDRRTYTFQLQPNVKFHDGTPFNSAAVKFSFERRVAINQGPAYMLAHVSSVATPTPTEVVVHLSSPVSAFLDYLASPFGPKMVSPTEIRAHEVRGDWGQHWLLEHDAGTGPYEITRWVPGQEYTLSRFAHYWGRAPGFSKVEISIVPDISIQEIELRSGALDMITHGLTPSAVASLASSPKKAGNLLVKLGCFIDIADVKDVIVARAGLSGFYHVPSIPWALNLATLRNG